MSRAQGASLHPRGRCRPSHGACGPGLRRFRVRACTHLPMGAGGHARCRVRACTHLPTVTGRFPGETGDRPLSLGPHGT